MKGCDQLDRQAQRRVLLPPWLRTPRCGQANSLPTFLIGFGLVLVYGFSDPPSALGQTASPCPQTGGAGGTITCHTGTTYTSGTSPPSINPINATPSEVVPAAGEGQSTTASTITVQHGATLQGTNLTSLSAGNGETINIGDSTGGATVTTTTNEGSNTNGSKYSGTGPNTVEAGANNTITISTGSTVSAVAGIAGPTGNGNAESEAINVMGFGNVIINHGTLFSNTSAAIFLQNTASLVEPAVPGGGHTNLGPDGTVGGGAFGTVILNYGVITAQPGPNAATTTEAISETVGTAENVFFANEVGATVNGNVNMGNGNDTVELFTGSSINGIPGPSNHPALSAGTGTDTLILNGVVVAGQPEGVLGGSLLGFNILTKTGPAPWEITGALDTSKSSLAAEIEQGTLILSGATTNFVGTMTVDSPGTLQIGDGGATGSFGGNITDNGIVAFDRSDNSPGLTYSNVISGTGQVQQIGPGTTTLTGVNTYSGGTFFNNGTLAAAADNNLGTGGLTFNGGTFQYNSGFTLTSTRPITINALGGTIDTQSFNPTIGQGMTGAGGLTKTGSGTLALTGANTYSGGTTISAGTLQLGAGGTTGSITGNVTDNGTLAFDRSNALTFAGVISGAGSVDQIGSGATTLDGANTYSGGTLLSAGEVIAGNSSALGTGALTVAGNATLGNAAAATSLANAIVLNPSTDLTIAGLNPLTLTGAISGAGALTKNGAATLVLTSDNSYSGGTTIAAGTLQVGNGGATGSVGTGPVLDDAALVFNRSGTVTVPGAITGTGSLTQEGAAGGTLVLTGTNTYSGGTTIASGTLQLGAGGTTGSITGNVTDNGALAFDRSDAVTFAGVISGAGSVDQIGSGTTILTGSSTYSGGTTISAGTLQLGAGGTTGSITGNVTDNGTLAFDRSNALTFAGVISGAGSVDQIGSGATTLDGANTYSGGTLLSAGEVIAGNSSALGTGALTVAGNATLGNAAAATSLANAIVLNPSTDLTIAGLNPLTLTGAISGAGALTKDGGATLVLTSDNSYSGGTTINTGILQIGNGGASGSVGTGPVLDDAALVFNRSGTVTVPGAITGTGSLTQEGAAGGTLVLTGANTYMGGTTIASGTLQLGNGGITGSIVGDVVDTGTLAFDRSDTVTFPGTISGSGAVAQIGSGATILNSDNPYTGGTTVSAGTLVVGDLAHPGAALSGGGPISVEASGTLGGYGSVTGTVVNSGVIAAGSATPGFIGSPTGTFNVIGNLTNQGTVQLGSGDSIGNVLHVNGNFIGAAGSTLAINTFLGGDGSPSDTLVISGAGAAATGNTMVHVTNVGGPGEETTANGILVVNATGGATTASGAFTLANGELRAGAFDYDLFRGGVSGSPNSWFLRSDFIVPPIPPEPPIPPIPPLPPTPPPNPLPPGVYPIIGPELATYGVAQPLARQLGLSILGTLDDRVGDTYEPDGCAVAPAAAETSAVDLPTKKPAALPTKKGPALAPCPLFSPSVWGRFFGQTVNNHYQAFADPRASGNLGGFQGGIDFLRGSLFAGQYERAGFYGAYGNVNSDVTGLVTNPAATAYILTHTGSMSLNAWSGGAYWTHVGPGGWYLDTVLQGTSYTGSAATDFARLNTDGWGFIASLEGGAPFAWPQLGPGFVLEPQGQILWQKVSFRHDYDGLGDVALGDTTGPSGRIGLRTKWTIVTAGGQVWEPYLRGNLWRDWGAEANTVFSGTDSVPLLNQATMLEFGGGLTGRINANVSVFANVDYEFAVGSGDDKRNGVRGAFGARYTW